MERDAEKIENLRPIEYVNYKEIQAEAPRLEEVINKIIFEELFMNYDRIKFFKQKIFYMN